MALLLFRKTFAPRGSRFYLGTCWLSILRLGCCALGVVTTEALGKLASVIRVYPSVVLRARNRHVREAVIYQEFALVRVHVNQNPVRGLSLAAVAGNGISVVEMRMLADIESNITTGVHSDFQIAGITDSLNGAKLSVGNLQLP